ncbi:hypothetical protein PFISCL1PPCAC_2942, partial [Pristionchus fissidentatus]
TVTTTDGGVGTSASSGSSAQPAAGSSAAAAPPTSSGGTAAASSTCYKVVDNHRSATSSHGSAATSSSAAPAAPSGSTSAAAAAPSGTTSAATAPSSSSTTAATGSSAAGSHGSAVSSSSAAPAASSSTTSATAAAPTTSSTAASGGTAAAPPSSAAAASSTHGFAATSATGTAPSAAGTTALPSSTTSAATTAPSGTTSTAAAPTSSTSAAASGTTGVPSGTTSATAAAPSSATSSVAAAPTSSTSAAAASGTTAVPSGTTSATTAAPSSTTSSVAAAPTSSTSTAASGTTAVPSGTTSATAAAPSSTTSSVAAAPTSSTSAAASGTSSTAASGTTVAPSGTTAGAPSAPIGTSHGVGASSATSSTHATTSASTSATSIAPAASGGSVASQNVSAPSSAPTAAAGSTPAAGTTAAAPAASNVPASTGSTHSLIHHRPGSLIVADLKHLAADVRHALQQLDGLHVQHKIASDIVQSQLDPSGQIGIHIPDILQPLLPALKWTTVSTNVQQLELIYSQLKVVYNLVSEFDATPDKYPKQIDAAAPSHSLAFKMILHEILRFIGPSQSKRSKILEKTEKLRDRVYALVHSKDDDLEDFSSLFETREHTLHCVHWNMAGISAPLLEHLGLVWYLVLDSPDVLLLSQVEASDYLITGLTRILGYNKFPSSCIINDPLPGSALLFRPRDNFVCTGAGSEGDIVAMESSGFEIVWADFMNLQTSKIFRLASLQYADAPALTVQDTMAAISISICLQEEGFQLCSSISASESAEKKTSSLRRFSSTLSLSMRRRKAFEAVENGILALATDQPHVRCHYPQHRAGRKRSPADPLNLPIPFSVGELVNPSRLPCSSKQCFYGCA